MEMGEIEELPTKVNSGYIKPIAKEVVHRISSGQVVVSLAIAVKELVENALDAGATLVEIKLKDHGLESLEVTDNGSGVAEHNIEAMTAKYHTSKLREYTNLLDVETFGFRGEALNSLCALADISIVTRHITNDVGFKMEFGKNGEIKKRTPCARSIGTTVSVVNLFSSLPVRRRDFARNVKKEFQKMCHMLEAYCLISINVRIICTNLTSKGVKTVVMQTLGAQDTLANITSIFGWKQAAEIVPISSTATDSFKESSCTTKHKSFDSSSFQLQGYVSSSTIGSGRSSKDRQFFYVNSRPCESRNFTKTVNEVYRQYNSHQYPFVLLNVVTARSNVDVNLTPDKRMLLVGNEQALLNMITEALQKEFQSTQSICRLQNSSIISPLHEKSDDIENSAKRMKLETVKDEATESPLPTSSVKHSKKKFVDIISQWKRTGETIGNAHATKRKSPDEVIVFTQKLSQIHNYLEKNTNSAAEYDVPNAATNEDAELKEVDDIFMQNLSASEQYGTESSGDNTPLPDVNASFNNANFEMFDDSQKTLDPAEANFEKSLTKIIKLDDDNSNISFSQKYATKMQISLEQIESNLKAEEGLRKKSAAKSKLDRLKFRSELCPNQNKNAEAELEKEISKSAFAQMKILGQFNLGFIIVKLDDDLFIVDQHATDEKYNFEMLQQTTVLNNQQLAMPQQLELTTVNEMVLMNHLEVFEKNGFKFEINENAPPTKKVRLLAKPISKNWDFGKDDIDELIFMLQDAALGTVCRPSRVRAMFASRACRKSVMIGQSLNRTAMNTLISHMGEIDQPWNCPHGRPTIRHLINIGMLIDGDE